MVSTTFASVPAMFGGLGPEAIGWLLVDEAGQAPPQQAAGAIWRARRTVVVGDPMQLEPVVTLPWGGQQALLRLFGVAEELGRPRPRCSGSPTGWPATACSAEERREWIGTVHTMQGKEADVVILVLGGNPAQPAARAFATRTPNLLNVAVSRAHRRSDVIGNRAAWAQEPYFDVLARHLGGQ